jgi:hypothetical protein
MRTSLIGAAGAFALAAVAFSGGAQAQCAWTGFDWSCAAAAPPAVTYYQPPYWDTPYAAFNAYDYRDYRYKPDWLPSYPGPRPGGR